MEENISGTGMPPQTQYEEDNIRHLSDMEHVRTRPGMYIGRLGDGSQAEDGVYVLLKEVVDNSIDEFKMNAGRRIEIRLTDNLNVSVRDYGRGIPEGELPHVKEKFYKGSSKNRGTGIGLSVCDEIVTRHGGELNIENADGGGCLVTILLPQQNGENHGR